MKLVIEIPEEDFKLIRSVNNSNLLPLTESRVMLAVKNGTPLPEHYGDLIDKKEVYKKFYSRCLAEAATEVLNEVPTIIPATNPPRWIERRLQMGVHDWMCSECKCQSEDTVRICPNCGVDTGGRYEMEEDDGGYWLNRTATKEGDGECR